MTNSRIDLMSGEQLELHSQPHWWYFWKQLLEGASVVILGLLALSFDGALGTLFRWLTVIAAIGFVVNLLYEFAQWRTTEFAVTNKRVIYNSGLGRQTGVSIPLDRVSNVNFSQSLIARMLNNGTLTIESASDTGSSVFENIPNPAAVRTSIFEQIDADSTAGAERDARAIARAVGGSGASVQPDTASRLEQLEQLHSSGHLTDAEYKAKREEILGDL